MVDLKLIDEGNPAEDARLFRRCMGLFATGVAIITTCYRGKMYGATVNSVASVSLDPPLVLWSIARTSRSFEAFQNAEGFVINIFSRDQTELSRHFSSSVEDKFADVAFKPGWNEFPTLFGCLAHIECKKEAAHDGGDHVIHVGRAMNVRAFDDQPLMFVQGRYAVPVDHPGARARPEVPQDSAEQRQKRSLMSLIFKAHHQLSRKFDLHRQAEGAHLSVTRVMDVLESAPDLKMTELLQRTYLGTRDIEDAIVEMQSKGLIEENGETFRLTEQGHKLREVIGDRWLQFEAEELAKLNEAEIQQMTEMLNRLTE